MPFQSEAQRRYLWANEPEIARDWTDTYGSRIQAALGGIMRLGYLHGGLTHPDGRRGFFEGAERDARAGLGAMSPGTGMTGAGRGLGDARGDAIKNYAVNPDFSTIGAPPSFSNRSTRPTHTPQTKGFLGRVGTNIKDYIMSGGLIGMGIRGISSLFGGTTPSTGNVGPAGLTNAGTYGTARDAINTGRRNESPVDRGDNQYTAPQYINDLYAQNIMEEDGIDIDTSTGNMEDWAHNFRVGNPYRQDKQGQLDPAITEMISKLYT